MGAKTKGRHTMRRALFAVAGLALALATTGCGGGGDDTRATIEGFEYGYDPETVTLAAGSIELRFENDGAIPHNLAFEEDTGLVAATNEEDVQQPGESVLYTFDLEPGTYPFFCSVPTHRELGMEGVLVIE